MSLNRVPVCHRQNHHCHHCHPQLTRMTSAIVLGLLLTRLKLRLLLRRRSRGGKISTLTNLNKRHYLSDQERQLRQIVNLRRQEKKREKNNTLEVSDTAGTGATPKSGGVHGNYVDYVVLQLGDHQEAAFFENALMLRQIQIS